MNTNLPTPIKQDSAESAGQCAGNLAGAAALQNI